MGGNLNREIEAIKKIQMEILKLKNIIAEIKSVNAFNSIFKCSNMTI